MSELDHLAEVSEARFMDAYRRIRPLLEEEARLVGALSRLDTQEKEARSTLADTASLQLMGAGMLWQGWVARSRKQLLIELAQLRARKLDAMEEVRQAFGRREAVRHLADRARADSAQAKRKHLLDELMRRS